MGAADSDPVDPIEEEDVEDWVQMRIIASVSHGILQMGALWPEAKHIISFIAAWVVDTFEDETESLAEQREFQVRSGGNRSQTMPAAAASGDGPPAYPGEDNTVFIRNDAVDADDEEEEPLSFTPKRMRSPSVRSPSSTNARLEGASPMRGSSFVKSPTERPQFPAVLSLKAEHGVGGSGAGSSVPSPTPAKDGDGSAEPGKGLAPEDTPSSPSSRTRPSSFHDISEARQRATELLGSANGHDETMAVQPAPSASNLSVPSQPQLLPGISSSVPGTRAASPHRLRGASPNATPLSAGGRRASRGPAATMDDRTKALLINEDSLLQRRRLEAVSGLGSSAVHDGSEDEEDDEYEQRRGRPMAS